jgi:hypothetical protein
MRIMVDGKVRAEAEDKKAGRNHVSVVAHIEGCRRHVRRTIYGPGIVNFVTAPDDCGRDEQ